MFCRLNFFLVFFHIFSVKQLNTFKIKSYNLNKYSQDLQNLDCPITKRKILIPRKFSFCFRFIRKYVSPKGPLYIPMFIGSFERNWTGFGSDSIKGINFAYWQYVPWIGLYSQGREDAPFVGMGDEFDFNMLTWRHTCFAFSLNDGNSIMYENGKLVSEKIFDEVVHKQLSPGVMINVSSVTPGGYG